jgi:phosphate transport system protein
LPRLMDMGLERLSNAIADMANLALDSVMKAIQAYTKGEKITQEALDRAHQLSILGTEVEELAVEIMARYQPVATDLRYIKSCLEVSYGFSRFGRYAYDIARVLEIAGDLSDCDKSVIEDMSARVTKMIQTSIQSFQTRDIKAARGLRHEDDIVDNTYLDYVRKLFQDPSMSTRCAMASTLVLRYLERIADHACYIGDSVIYITTGAKA